MVIPKKNDKARIVIEGRHKKLSITLFVCFLVALFGFISAVRNNYPVSVVLIASLLFLFILSLFKLKLEVEVGKDSSSNNKDGVLVLVEKSLIFASFPLYLLRKDSVHTDDVKSFTNSKRSGSSVTLATVNGDAVLHLGRLSKPQFDYIKKTIYSVMNKDFQYDN